MPGIRQEDKEMIKAAYQLYGKEVGDTVRELVNKGQVMAAERVMRKNRENM